jgi:hypothetical protein
LKSEGKTTRLKERKFLAVENAIRTSEKEIGEEGKTGEE